MLRNKIFFFQAAPILKYKVKCIVYCQYLSKRFPPLVFVEIVHTFSWQAYT